MASLCHAQPLLAQLVGEKLHKPGRYDQDDDDCADQAHCLPMDGVVGSVGEELHAAYDAQEAKDPKELEDTGHGEEGRDTRVCAQSREHRDDCRKRSAEVEKGLECDNVLEGLPRYRQVCGPVDHEGGRK